VSNAPQTGEGFIGAFQSALLPSAANYPLKTAYVYDSGSGLYMYSDGVRWKPFGNSERATIGYRVGVCGASTAERFNVLAGCDQTTYSRTKVNGVGTATIRTNAALPNLTQIGRKFRITSDKDPRIEGFFTIQSVVPEAGATRLTWIDDRDDLGPSSLPASDAINYVDPYFYTVSSGILAHASILLGGRLDPVVVACGSTNIIDDWSLNSQLPYNRIDQLLAQGPFAAIVVGAGIFGNAFLAGYGGDTVYASLVKLVNRLRGAAPHIFVEEPTSTRNVLANGAAAANQVPHQGMIYTAGARFLRKLWRDLAADCPFATIIPVNSVLTTPTVGTYSGAQADVDNAWPPVDSMNSDGTHSAYGASRLWGAAWADVFNRVLLPWLPEVGVYPDTVWNATYADTDGNPNMNIHSNWFDTVPTVAAGAPVTGVCPQGCTVTVANVNGSMSAVSSVVQNPEGGYDWMIQFADTGSGTNQGEIITLFDRGYTNQKLVTKLQAAAGKTLDIFVPIWCADMVENTIYAVECTLQLDYGSGLQQHCGWSDSGTFKMAGIGRAIDAGFNGVLRMPKQLVPADIANIVDAAIVMTVTVAPNQGVGLNLNFGIGAGVRVDIY
jgi:hypothetical protein